MAAASPPLWRHKDGVLPNVLAFAYIFLGHLLGLVLLTSGNVLAFLPGIILTGHSMVIAAYMIHELAHGTIFTSRTHARWMGEFMCWITGTAYASFDRIRHMHLRHHGDRADLAFIDYRAYVTALPQGIRKLLLALEWLHIPALELLLLFRVRFGPFTRDYLKHERARVVLVWISRWSLLGGLFLASPLALLGYMMAYALFIKIMHLGDAFAHTYEEYVISTPDEPVPNDGRDNAYDHDHTYSNLISRQFPVLNLINLNFAYHNAHHYHAVTPWHRLPALHAKLYDAEEEQVLPFAELWRSIHRNRLKVILENDMGSVGKGQGRADDFLGVHGVSFLSVV